MPYYEVIVKVGPKDEKSIAQVRLVEADNPSQAVRFVADGMIEARLLKAPEVVAMMEKGRKVERIAS